MTTIINPEALDKLRREYRPSMPNEVLHAWAEDVVDALAELQAAPAAAGVPDAAAVAAHMDEVVQYIERAYPDATMLDRGPILRNLRRWSQRLRNAQPAAQPQAEQHPDDVAVDRFASAMKEKLAMARTKGRGGWEDPAQCTAADLSRMLREHVAKGDPRDVANFCMMLHQRGESITQAEQQPSEKCSECGGSGEYCLAGHSAHPDNWRKCERCGGPGQAEQQGAGHALPPLPFAFFDEFGRGSDDRVQDYARAALAARQPVGEPVEYQYRFWNEEALGGKGSWSSWMPIRKSDYDREFAEPSEGREVRALYTAPPRAGGPGAVPRGGGIHGRQGARDVLPALHEGLAGADRQQGGAVMAVERKDPSRVMVIGGTEEDVARHIELDFRIRSGLCPNGHGLLEATDYGQRCPACGFFCNTRAELTRN